MYHSPSKLTKMRLLLIFLLVGLKRYIFLKISRASISWPLINLMTAMLFNRARLYSNELSPRVRALRAVSMQSWNSRWPEEPGNCKASCKDLLLAASRL